MARTKKTKQQQPELRVETIEEYMARGGRIRICPPGMRSEELEPMGSPRGYGRKKGAAGKKKA